MIGEAFALTTAHRKSGALLIRQFASVVPEIKFGQIPMHMLFCAVLVNAAIMAAILARPFG
jgi:hypothetical protein